MNKIRTLIQMAGINPSPNLRTRPLSSSTRKTKYVNGKLPLRAWTPLAEIEVAARARAPPVHPSCMSMSARRRLFDPDASGGQIAAKVAPFAGEAVIDKRLPNAFAGTDLNDRLAATQRKNLVVVGFMTHLCVSSTVRAALDHGYACTVVAGATGTRDLPAASGESVIPAQVIHEATLASLADRFAVVVQTAADLPD